MPPQGCQRYSKDTMRRRSRALLALLGLVGAALLGSALNLGGSSPPSPFLDGRVWIVAHQGGEGLWPSNTREAFDRAAALGVDMLDTDVHMTRDGHLVAIHDASVNRTTNGRGLVKDLALARLQSLDAAYNFSLNGGRTFPWRGKGVRVPTLDELFAAHGDLAWTVEMKQVEPSIARPLCDLIRRRGMSGRVIVASFKDAAMREFRAACPEVATGMTEREVRPLVLLNLLGLGGWYRPSGNALQVPPRAAGLNVVTRRFVAVAHRKNLVVQPWTINDEAEMRRLIALGVDGLNTDRPDVLKRVLGGQPAPRPVSP